MRDALIPAAQYLRMSTEHQQYSIENQAHVLGLYAAKHGFEVIHSYIDAGKGGLVLKDEGGAGKAKRSRKMLDRTLYTVDMAAVSAKQRAGQSLRENTSLGVSPDLLVKRAKLKH